MGGSNKTSPTPKVSDCEMEGGVVVAVEGHQEGDRLSVDLKKVTNENSVGAKSVDVPTIEENCTSNNNNSDCDIDDNQEQQMVVDESEEGRRSSSPQSSEEEEEVKPLRFSPRKTRHSVLFHDESDEDCTQRRRTRRSERNSPILRERRTRTSVNPEEETLETGCNDVIKSLLLELLSTIQSKCDGYDIFSSPVDPIEDGCEDYYEVIDKENEAMDLGTIESLIEESQIVNVDELEKYIDRMVAASRKYNVDADNFVRIQTEKLAEKVPIYYKKYRGKIETTMRKLNEEETGRKRQQGGSESTDEDDERSFSVGYDEIDDASFASEVAALRRSNREKRRSSRLTSIEDSSEEEVVRISRCQRKRLDTTDSVENTSCLRRPRRQAATHSINYAEKSEKDPELVHRWDDESSDSVGLKVPRRPISMSFPCGAKIYSETLPHDEDTARLVVSRFTKHGAALHCTHPTCKEDGSMYTFCAYCRIPVSKTFYKKRHSHSKEEKEVLCQLALEEKSSNTASSSNGIKDINSSIRKRKIPCPARGMPDDHTSMTAYFQVSEASQHGDNLLCSHAECAARGVKFRYCAFCDKGVSKMMFDNRHSHEGNINSSSSRRQNQMSSLQIAPVTKNEKNTNYSFRHQYRFSYRDAGIPGSDIPPCRKDMEDSFISKCNKRNDWLNVVPDLLVVCNEAARRSTLSENPLASRYDKPLSETYIKERLDYDKPLMGYIVKTHDELQQVQGFITACKFATFRSTFRWDSLAPQAGIKPIERRSHKCDNGNLACQLQDMSCVGNIDDGFVFERIAEISLLGGLGCGGKLLKRMLEDLDKSRKYDFVVLQATKIAIPFYERFGFVRVGAVARFEDNEDCPEVAYRHWADVVEGRAVEASYMMALKLSSSKLNGLEIDAEFEEDLPLPSDTPRTTQKKFSMLEVADAEKSLKAAHDLVREALKINTDSTAGEATYVELVSLARDSALSVGQKKLGKEVKLALMAFKNESVEMSKELLMKAFGVKLIKVQRITVDNRQLDTGGVYFRKGREKVLGLEALQDETYSWSTTVETSLSPVPQRNVTVHISFKKDTSRDRPPLVASLPALDYDNYPRKEASALAFKNFYEAIHSKSTVHQDNTVVPGSFIMLPNKSAYCWSSAVIVRKCRKNEAPSKDSAGVSYMCELDTGHTKPLILDSRSNDRGIGRKWCTVMDWLSFSLLPVGLLNKLLVGSTVRCSGPENQEFRGLIIGYKGGGLKDKLQWVVEGSVDSNKKKDHIFLTSSQIREVVDVRAENIKRVKAALENVGDGSRPIPKSTADADRKLEPTWLIPHFRASNRKLSVSDMNSLEDSPTKRGRSSSDNIARKKGNELKPPSETVKKIDNKGRSSRKNGFNTSAERDLPEVTPSQTKKTPRRLLSPSGGGSANKLERVDDNAQDETRKGTTKKRKRSNSGDSSVSVHETDSKKRQKRSTRSNTQSKKPPLPIGVYKTKTGYAAKKSIKGKMKHFGTYRTVREAKKAVEAGFKLHARKGVL